MLKEKKERDYSLVDGTIDDIDPYCARSLISCGAKPAQKKTGIL